MQKNKFGMEDLALMIAQSFEELNQRLIILEGRINLLEAKAKQSRFELERNLFQHDQRSIKKTQKV
jgi:hypothetical protein